MAKRSKENITLGSGIPYIMAYSGYTWAQLLAMENPAVFSLLRQCDILVDGPFVEAQRDLSLRFRGSRNQRLIDVQKSLREGKVITTA